MGKCFKHREYCAEVKKLPLFGKIYLFKFPNGTGVEVSRERMVGDWKVWITWDKDGVHTTIFSGYKGSKDVETLLKSIKEAANAA